DARTPLKSKLVRTARSVPTLIVCRSPGKGKIGATARRIRALERAGCEILDMRPATRNLISPLLSELFERRMTNILVEGGGRVLGSFWDMKMVDEVRIFVAPRLIGGAGAPGPLHGMGCEAISDIM